MRRAISISASPMKITNIMSHNSSMAEPEPGVEYYFEHAKDRDREITLYRALDVVKWMGEDDLWMEVYKYGLMKKIEPRDSLKKMYEERRGQKN